MAYYWCGNYCSLKIFGVTMADLDELRLQAEIELRKLEAKSTAKEVASKSIGKSAIPWIVLLVIVGVVSAAFLPVDALPAVIGLVSTASMALISMLSGITGTNDKEEKPEFALLHEMLSNIAKDEPMSVTVEDDKVTVSKGSDTIVSGGQKGGRRSTDKG